MRRRHFSSIGNPAPTTRRLDANCQRGDRGCLGKTLGDRWQNTTAAGCPMGTTESIFWHFISMEIQHAPGTMKRLDMLTERLPRQGEGKVTRLISHVRHHANGEWRRWRRTRKSIPAPWRVVDCRPFLFPGESIATALARRFHEWEAGPQRDDWENKWSQLQCLFECLWRSLCRYLFVILQTLPFLDSKNTPIPFENVLKDVQWHHLSERRIVWGYRHSLIQPYDVSFPSFDIRNWNLNFTW